MFTSPRSSSSALFPSNPREKRKRRRERRNGSRVLRSFCSVRGVLLAAPPLVKLSALNRMEDVKQASEIYPYMEYSDRNLSVFSQWFLKAVKCICHCVSIEAPSLTVISPFCTLGILQWTSPCFPISLPNADWQATCVLFCILSAYLLLSYLSPHAACVSWRVKNMHM